MPLAISLEVMQDAELAAIRVHFEGDSITSVSTNVCCAVEGAIFPLNKNRLRAATAVVNIV